MNWLLRTCTWVLLGGWLGSFGLFAFVIAPTAFRVLPSHAVAGDLVSPVLALLHVYGIVAGICLGLLGWLANRGRAAILLPLALAAVCATSEYAVTPAIEAVEPLVFGDTMTPEAARRFSDLHEMSRMLFGLVWLGVLGLIVLHARTETGD